MGKIFYIIGPSASGKDSLARELLRRFEGELKTVVMSTTRPIRSGEVEDETYHYLTAEEFEALKAAGKVIESRTYQTVYGPWIYATIDSSIDLSRNSYLMVGTLESYRQTRRFFGEEAVVPLYIELDRGLRLQRALDRERTQKEPKYTEMCRRFLADEKDFSAAKVAACHFPRVYVNEDFMTCADEMSRTIREVLG
ncbi:MAG: guanylate kinase [Lachnospiraceae bacterium]|nr:guanylate kinase [Lachnospiraceae bacterium]